MVSNIKQELIESCDNYIEQRINRILAGISDLEEALKLETKCSVGDKYETGRAMLHLEFEKLSAQLEQYKRMKKTLSLVKTKVEPGKIVFGSVVKTTKANYFISVPAGEIILNGKRFYAIGAGSPVAQVLIQKKQGDTFIFNGTEDSIVEII